MQEPRRAHSNQAAAPALGLVAAIFLRAGRTRNRRSTTACSTLALRWREQKQIVPRHRMHCQVQQAEVALVEDDGAEVMQTSLLIQCIRQAVLNMPAVHSETK